MTVKEQLHKIVDELPDENAVEEMQYRLYVLRKIEKGLAAIEEGRVVSHEEMRERIKQWLPE